MLFESVPLYSNKLTFDDRYINERFVLNSDYGDVLYKKFFAYENVQFISDEITKRLKGLRGNSNISVLPTTIISVMDSIWNNEFRDLQTMTIQTITYIVNHIRTEYQMEEQNKKLSIWVTNYPADSGLQQTPKIKLRNRRLTSYVSWNY